MTVRFLLLAGAITFASINCALNAQEHKSTNPQGTQANSKIPEPGKRSGEITIKPTHDEIVKWMNAYFAEYNASAQVYAKSVHRMDVYFAPDFTFIPYTVCFRRASECHYRQEAFYDMLTNHPSDYEKFIVHDIFVDETRMVAVAFLEATIFETGTNRVKVKKNYLPLYELKLDDKGALKIATIRFFWEALPPEVAMVPPRTVDKSKWGSKP